MKKRRIILVGIGLIAAVVVAIFISPGEREPEYQGKRLSEWLLRYPPPYDVYGEREEEHPEIEEAVRHIGTNAIPLLLKWSDYEIPRWRVSAIGRVDRLLAGDGAIHRRVMHTLIPRSEKLAEHALRGFEILGPQAAPAIPDLVRRMNRTNSPIKARVATSLLGQIGEPAIPALLQGLTNQLVAVRQIAALAMCKVTISTNEHAVARALSELLRDPNVFVRSAATNALRKIAPEMLPEEDRREGLE